MQRFKDEYPPPPPQPDYPDDFGFPPPPPEVSRTYGLTDDFPPPPPSEDKPVTVHKATSGYSTGGYGEPSSSYSRHSELIQSPTGVIKRTAEKSTYSSQSADPGGSPFSRNYANVSSLKQSSSSSYQYKGDRGLPASKLPFDSRSERAVPGPQVPSSSWDSGVAIPIVVKTGEHASSSSSTRSFDHPVSSVPRQYDPLPRSYNMPYESPYTREKDVPIKDAQRSTSEIRSYQKSFSEQTHDTQRSTPEMRPYQSSFSEKSHDTQRSTPEMRPYQSSFSEKLHDTQRSTPEIRSYQSSFSEQQHDTQRSTPEIRPYQTSFSEQSHDTQRSTPEIRSYQSSFSEQSHDTQRSTPEMRPYQTSFSEQSHDLQRSPPEIRPYQQSFSEKSHGTHRSMPEKATVKEAEVDALTNLLMQNMEAPAENFFGTCSKCGRCVEGESNGCTAMDQVFHISCFTCVTCGKPLKGQSFFSMDNKPYCEACYMNTLEKCSVCSKAITDRLLRATGKPYHPACFTCVVCGKSLDGIPFTVDATSQIHCIEDFHRKFAPRCCVCSKPIMPDGNNEETVRVVAMDKSFHVQCYRCEDCGTLLSSEAEGRGCYPLDEHILCKNCNAQRIQAMTTKMTTEL